MKTKFEKLPNYGTHMSIADFISAVNTGFFTNDDGIGFYATKTHMSNIQIFPSDVYNSVNFWNGHNKELNYIMWFNK